MKRALHLAFWAAQPLAAVSIGVGLLLVDLGRRALRKEAEMRQ